MDSTILILKLDQIREDQIRQGEAIEELIRNSRTGSTQKESSLEKWFPLMKAIGVAAAQYGTGLLILGYVLKGGDVMTAVSMLAKLL